MEGKIYWYRTENKK